MTIDVATLVEVVIGFTLLEAAVLLWLDRRAGRGVAPRDFLANMMSGLCLMLALRAHDAGTAVVGLWLLAAGVAHATDLVMRWRRLPAARRRRRNVSFDEVSA